MPASRPRWTAAVLACLAVGCSATPDATPVSIEPGQTYHAPADNFTIVVPPLLGDDATMAESETGDQQTAGVLFADAFGTREAVLSRHIADDDPQGQSRGGTRALADAFLNGTVLPELQRSSPGAVVLRTTANVETTAGPATFAVVRVPDGGVGRGPAVRGLLAFPRLRWVYVVSYQQWPPTPNQPPMTDAQRDDRLLADLRQTVGQMTFN